MVAMLSRNLSVCLHTCPFFALLVLGLPGWSCEKTDSRAGDMLGRAREEAQPAVSWRRL